MSTRAPFPLLRYAFLAGVLAVSSAPAADAPPQPHFATPEAAIRALAKAAGGADDTAVLALLGPGAEDVVSSGDPVQDRNTRERFVRSVGERLQFEKIDDHTTIANIGKDDWPFPVPMVQDADGWRFNTADAREEIINRRIGRNELHTAQTCRAYVDAQREYASRDRTGAGAGVYAQKVRSEPGKRDGLYWEEGKDGQKSPLGPLLAEASAEGYGPKEAGAPPSPYHGYILRILTAQGANAPGGARSYLKDGKMNRGFALLAYPAEPGVSGVMTFIVGPEGVVFQKNLGEKTVDVAKAITAYDPDDSWNPVRD